jgi:hypothetical protein
MEIDHTAAVKDRFAFCMDRKVHVKLGGTACARLGFWDPFPGSLKARESFQSSKRASRNKESTARVDEPICICDLDRDINVFL